MVRKGKERAAPSAAAADDDDEASERATQLNGQDALWLSGAARQARADAHVHQVAAGLASGAKRKANAMTPEERLEKRAADKRRRIVEKKAAQAAAVLGDAEAVAAVEAAEREADAEELRLEEELQEELQERICERFGEPWLIFLSRGFVSTRINFLESVYRSKNESKRTGTWIKLNAWCTSYLG